jgi:hypothetical protein
MVEYYKVMLDQGLRMLGFHDRGGGGPRVTCNEISALYTDHRSEKARGDRTHDDGSCQKKRHKIDILNWKENWAYRLIPVNPRKSKRCSAIKKSH